MPRDPYALEQKRKQPGMPAAGTLPVAGQPPPPMPTAGTLPVERPQPTQAQPAARPVDHRGAPTNFTNFARRFGANRDVAKREAGKYANQATTAAGKASASLGAARTTFANGVNTGTGAPPPGSNAPVATNTGAAIPVATPAQAPTVAAPPVSNSQALTGESTRPGVASQGLEGESTRPGDGMTIADMLAKAGQRYTGPMGLENTEQATADAGAAQEQLDLLGNQKTATGEGGIQTLVNEGGGSGSRGSDALSGALIGAAGRQNFDALRARFNPNKELLDAQSKAMKTAEEAKRQSDSNAAGWGKMAADAQGVKDEQDSANSANDAQAKAGRDAAASANEAKMPPKSYQFSYGQDTPENQEAYMLSGVDPSDVQAVAKRKGEIASYYKAQTMTTQQQMDRTFGDFNSMSGFSPSTMVANASGNQDPTQNAAKNQYGFLSVDGGGKAAPTNIAWDRAGVDGFFVWRQMTPDQWAALSKLPSSSLFGNDQKSWIQERARQLREAQNSQPANAAHGTSRSS